MVSSGFGIMDMFGCVLVGLLSSCALLIACISNRYFGLEATIEQSEGPAGVSELKASYDLVIAVMSARENLRHRQVIRQTWKSCARKLSVGRCDRVKVWFVIGSEACDIPAADRVDDFQCFRWRPDLSALNEDQELVVGVPGTENVFTNLYCITEIRFKVLYPIVVKRFGLYKSLNLHNESVYIYLYDHPADEMITHVQFCQRDAGMLYNNYRYQPVESYLLPKDFEGRLLINHTCDVENLIVDETVKFNLHDGGKLLHFFQSELHNNENTTGLPLISFMFSAYDKQKLKKHIEESETRTKEWKESKAKEQENLIKETEKYGDIILLNITDTYRALPLKLLHFHYWISKHVNSLFILKTDDDCYVDVDRILQDVKKLKNTHKLWWGNFRSNWAVDSYGKWREKDYTAPVYPKFACGSGNIVSYDINQWIVMNFDYLKTYQGEDVSMGIWLAAIGPNFLDDERWQCAKTCHSQMYVLPELSPSEMRMIWTAKRTCGNPCLNFKMDKVCEKLDNILLDYFDVLECLYEHRNKLEQNLKAAFLHLSRARYIRGAYSTGMLQINKENISASTLVDILPNQVPAIELFGLKSDVRKRKTFVYENVDVQQKENYEDNHLEQGSMEIRLKKTLVMESKEKQPKDPLKAFGIFVPQNLRYSQKGFQTVIELTIDIVNLQFKLQQLKKMYQKYIQEKIILQNLLDQHEPH